MHQHKNNGRTTALAKRAMLGAMVATAFAASSAAPASATVAAGADAPETGGTSTVFHNLDFIAYFAAPSAEDVIHRVEVIREGVVVGRATGPARDGGEGPALEVNHGGASGPGDCWEGVTPDVKPGDRIKVTNSRRTTSTRSRSTTSSSPATRTR